MNILIVDDEKKARETIVEMVKLYAPAEVNIHEADGVSSAVEQIKKVNPDLLLLDINLKDGMGFDVLTKSENKDINVIFITAYEEYALKACKMSALDYLLKPVDPDELEKALLKAYNKTDKEKIFERVQAFMENMKGEKQAKKITLKTSDSIYIINVDDIVYCEADGNYTTFKLMDDRRIVVSKPLGDYEDMINRKEFIRTHQSFLVNMNHVIKYEKGDGGVLITANNQQVPVSTRKKEFVMQYFQNM